jgi:NADH-quinone oxidoreductase subunit G
MTQEHAAFASLQPFDLPPEGLPILPDLNEEKSFSSPPSPSRGEDEEESDSLELLLVDWTFGTEELSAYSRFIQQVEKTPYLLMHGQDAARLGLKDQDKVIVHLDGGPLEVGLRVADNMARGVMILPRHRQLAWQKLKDVPTRIPIEQIRKA